MNRQTFLYLCANFIDKYSCELAFSDDQITKQIGEDFRKVHHELQNFLRVYDCFFDTKGDGYYDFMFENSIKNKLSIEELMKKYLKEVKNNE